MDIAQLVLEFAKALAWPLVTVLAIFVFRSPVVAVLRRIKAAGLPGGVSLDFDREVLDAHALSKEVAKAPNRPPKKTPMLPLTEANARMLQLGLQPSPSGLDMTRYLDLAREDPNLALAGLRMEVEVLARNLARGFQIEIRSRDSTATLLRALVKGHAITHQQFDLAQRIVRLCNAAVHGQQVSREDAEAVIDTAQVLATDFLAWLSWGFPVIGTPRHHKMGRMASSALLPTKPSLTLRLCGNATSLDGRVSHAIQVCRMYGGA